MTDRFWFFKKGAPVEYVIVDGQTQEKICVCQNLHNVYYILDTLNEKDSMDRLLDRAWKTIRDPNKFPTDELIRDLARFRD